jgi:hypothetical protein
LQLLAASKANAMDLLHVLVVLAFFAPFVFATARGASEE